MKSSAWEEYDGTMQNAKEIFTRLEQDRDHWRQAYCKAEQECARLEAWATELYRQLQEERKK